MRIEDMSIDDLLELNHYICERIDYLRERKNAESIAVLRPGDKIAFTDKYGDTQFGVLLKKNRKTVVVMTADKTQWKIPAGMARLIKDVN